LTGLPGVELPGEIARSWTGPTPARTGSRRRLPLSRLVSSLPPPCPCEGRPAWPNARSSARCRPTCPGSTSEGRRKRCRHRPL